MEYIWHHVVAGTVFDHRGKGRPVSLFLGMVGHIFSFSLFVLMNLVITVS